MPDPDAQLGEIVVGKKPGRERDRERIINHNYGMAIHDVAMARDENIVVDFPYFKSPRHLHRVAPSYDLASVEGTEVIYCANCGRDNEPPAKFCAKCGSELIYE